MLSLSIFGMITPWCIVTHQSLLSIHKLVYNGSFQTLLFTNEVYEILARETNLYAWQKVAVKPDPKWRDMEKDEMKACIGIHVYKSAVKLPKTQMYWG